MHYKEQTRQSYQEIAIEYASRVADLAPMPSIEKYMSLLPSNPSILDIGCGSGRDAKIFSDKGAKVTGIDFCENLLSIAKVHASEATFILMDMEELSFLPSSFDGAWAASSLVHLSKESLPILFAKVYAVLKVGGHFYFTLKKGTGEGIEKDERYEGRQEKYWSYYEEPEVKKLLEKMNFKLLELSHVARSAAYHSHDVLRVYSYKSP